LTKQTLYLSEQDLGNFQAKAPVFVQTVKVLHSSVVNDSTCKKPLLSSLENYHMLKRSLLVDWTKMAINTKPFTIVGVELSTS